MATERFRKNSISSLQDDDGNIISDHQQMAGMLWGTFRDRMGVSTGIDMRFDLGSLIETVDGLNNLSAPFSEDEINEVLKSLPTDRAPGPDGFTGLFVKRCWHIIKHDFFAAFPGFL